MDGIVLINKEKNISSREMVNKVCKILNTRRIGHTGTLDPIATGLMVLCVNAGCKLVEMLTSHDKEYIAKVKLGIKTDTYDITGNILEENDNYSLTKEELEKTLNSFLGTYSQEVPMYSAIKVRGKKLYEYARSKEKVLLPKHLVTIKKIELLDFKDDSFTFKTLVSSGTYIRSLINDIGNKLNIFMTMEELERTQVGNFKLADACSLQDIKIIPLVEAINLPKIEITSNDFYKKVSNGVRIENIYQNPKVMFVKDNHLVAIYEDMGNGLMKSYRIFKD